MPTTITTYLIADYYLELASDFSELVVKQKSDDSIEETYPTDPGISVQVLQDATGDAYKIVTASCATCFPLIYTHGDTNTSLSFDGAKMIGVGVVRIEDSGLRTIEFLLDVCPVYLSLDGNDLTVGVTAKPDQSGPSDACINILP